MTGDGRTGRVRRAWSDLPGDILDIVYRGCCSSPYDRARFAAVCTSWRAVASWHPKMPFLPLLLPSTGDAKRDRKTRAYSLEEGRALRRPLRGFPWGKRIVGSHDDGWVAAVTGTRLLVVNVFSGARIALSSKQSIIGGKCPTRRQAFNQRSKVRTEETTIKKIIFSEDPSSSSSCILVAITANCKVALCRIGCPDHGWTIGGSSEGLYGELTDIAFCNGKLYGLTRGELFKFVIGVNENGAPPVVTSVHPIPIERNILRECWGISRDKYIFELHGKLAIAVKFSPRIDCCSDHYFRVFELDDDVEYKPMEVTSLGDHALFLGPACCKVVHVPVTSVRGRVERNHIYYSEQRLCPQDDVECLNRLDLGSYTVYYGKNEGVDDSERIMSWGYHYSYEDGSNGCVWLLPPDF